MKKLFKTISASVITGLLTSSVLTSGIGFAAEQGFGEVFIADKVVSGSYEVTPTPTAAAQTSSMNLWISNATGKVGDMVTVDVNLSNVPERGFASGLFDVNYDQTNLEFVSCEAGDIVYDPTMDISYNVLSDKLKIMYSNSNYISSTCIKSDGVLCKLTFKIKNTGNMDIYVTSEKRFYDGSIVALPKTNFYAGTIIGVPTVAPTATPTIAPTVTATPTVTSTATPTVAAKSSSINLSISNATGKVGDTVAVNVNLSNVPESGFISGVFDVNYDQRNLEFVSCEAGDIVNDPTKDISYNATSEKLRIMYCDNNVSSSTCIKSNGMLCKLTFKIKAKGVFKLEANSTDKFYDNNLSPLPSVKFKSGKIAGIAKKNVKPHR